MWQDIAAELNAGLNDEKILLDSNVYWAATRRPWRC
jgi:hypothetical protein